MNALEEIVKMVEENKVLNEQMESKTREMEKLASELEQSVTEIDDLRLTVKEQEKTIAELMCEKQQIVSTQVYKGDLKKDLEQLIKRIQGYDKELRAAFDELTAMQKDLAMYRVQFNNMSQNKVRLEGILNDQMSCLKRLMNIQ